MTGTIDPITLEVLTQALISTVREMRATVCRTASSVAIYDAKDFSCGLFGPDSQVVAQSEDIGSHVVPLPWSVRSAMAKLGETLAPGDVILVRLGDIVPADARLLEGDSIEVDQSALTGESLPATRKPGEAVFSGSIVR